MTSLLDIEQFCLRFASNDSPVDEQFQITDVNLTLNEGETHALVGESGSGKSITALSIMRLLDDITDVQTSGRIVFCGHDITLLSPTELRALRGNEISMIFQEPMTSLNPVYTVGNQLIEPLLLHQKLSKKEAYQAALSLLERTGIHDPEYRIHNYPYQLSGGQRQRVVIAMALACRPKLLIADEPTTALDITVQEQILNLIRDLQQELNMAVLLITHNLPMVRKRSDTISIMHQGRIVEQGNTAEIFKKPKQEYTRHLLNAVPNEQKISVTGKKKLMELERVSCSFIMGYKWQGLRRKKITFNAVDQVSLNIIRGTTLGVVGESGSGKSTLALCILGLNGYTGDIRYHREQGTVDLNKLSSHAFRPLRKEIQIVFQDPYSSLSPRMSIEQIIEEGLRVHRKDLNKKQRIQLVAEALQEVELDPGLMSRFPHEFSGGQRQRIAIARALILKPSFLILDEPTSALDMTIQKQILLLLKKIQKTYGITYMFISHDLRTIRAIADHVVVMQNGRIIESGDGRQIFTNPEQEYTRKLFEAAFQS
ncbi:ABC transporter ATP-binding protein [Desulfogranum japonicum]|uniref:ABC transporter ATP-binding protein n=1 Tax=Desulfogranum japonicum TaxID=231447 RepID=UPI0004010DF7|nr:dipeptide ABC transporter ATP-binding protein [Desulfogranum japonicum]